jgi:hypothetical protein
MIGRILFVGSVLSMVEWDGVLSGLHFCSHCRKTMMVRLGFDVGVIIHWVDDVLLFDVVLLFEGVGNSYVLYRETYGFK